MRKNEASPSIYREVAGIFWFGLAVLVFLSLISFDPNDLPFFSSHINPTTANFIGPIGAHSANVLLFLFGAGSYLVPVLAIVIGGMLFMQQPVSWRWKAVWSGAFLVSATCLLELQPYFGRAWASKVNVVGPGGFVGQFLNEYVFYFLGHVGSAIILTLLYLTSIWFLFDLHPRQMALSLRNWYEQWLEYREEKKAEKDPVARLQLKEKRLDRQRRELEKQIALNATQTAKPMAPIPTPKVIDTSLPSSQRRASAREEKKEKAPEAAAVALLDEKPAVEEKTAKGAKAKKAASEVKVEDEPEMVITIGTDKVEEKVTEEKPRPTRSKPADAMPATSGASGSIPGLENYKMPTVDLLRANSSGGRPTANVEELQANSRLLVETLKQFGIEARPGDITKGATITRYEVYPADGVRVDKITSLQRDLARTMKAEKIHILAPIPGKDSVGIEIANSDKVPIVLRDLFEASSWGHSRAKIPLALGKNVYGETLVADLAEMPHMLIAGTTGSGKSVSINCILLSLLYKFKPDELRLILVDPKQVELQVYNSIPHLVVPVVTDPKKVLLALRWVIKEMEDRYKILAKVGVRNIDSFNNRVRTKPKQAKLDLGEENETENGEANSVAAKRPKNGEEIHIPDHLPYIVVIIDELADLMQTAPADVETAIARLTAKARAAGIHLIIATQTPRREVITGVIKTNIPSRMAFQVPSALDSRVILDENGAENLLGKGDLLYLPPGSPKLVRGQGAYVSDDEVKTVVEFISAQIEQQFHPEIHQKISSGSSGMDDVSGEDMELLEKCFEVIRQEKRASTSMLQRRLRLGYNRAAWAMDHFERLGIVGPENGAKPREILVDLDNYDLPTG